jgi:hypothetical protein
VKIDLYTKIKAGLLIGPLVPGTAGNSGARVKDTLLFLEGVLWRFRLGTHGLRYSPSGISEVVLY